MITLIFNRFYKIKVICNILILTLINLSSFAFAQNVTHDQASDIAKDFFKSHGLNSTVVKPVSNVTTRSNGNKPYYIFNDEAGSAFVVISGDSRTDQVLAYSTEGAFDENNIAPGAKYWLQQYEDYINSIQNVKDLPVLARSTRSSSNGKLIKTAEWNQSHDFWWSKAPEINGYNAYAGCVATAMAILMRHYEWPDKGVGSNTYTSRTEKLKVSANFEEIDYNLSTLPKGDQSDAGWTAQKQDIVATLLFHCGASVFMDYGYFESSAYSSEVVKAMYRNFKYTFGKLIRKNAYSDQDWINIIIDEINQDHPLFYDGTNSSSKGHAFICDGYDANNLIHFNFGWSGNGNGYYTLALTGGDTFDYNRYQGMIIGMYPDRSDDREVINFWIVNNSNGLILFSNENIKRNTPFSIRVDAIENISNNTLTPKVYIYLCDGTGTRKQKVGESESITFTTGGTSAPIINCNFSNNYTPSDDDYLYAFYSLDNGTTLTKIACKDSSKERIHVKDLWYEIKHLKMLNSSSSTQIGLTVDANYPINYNGDLIKINCNRLKNLLTETFNGEVGIFICAENGTRKVKTGSTTLTDYKNTLSDTYEISCAIEPTTNLVQGDRLCAYSRLSTDAEDEWALIECEVPEKGYIVLDITPGVSPHAGEIVNVGGLNYQLNEDFTCSVVKYTASNYYSGDYNIPTSINYDNESYIVTEIGISAFLNCSQLNSVTIPNSVTTIKSFAFEKSGIRTAHIPNSVKSIGTEIFAGCSNLSNIDVDETNINYSSLDGVMFNKNKTTILSFPGGYPNSTYTIPNSVKSITFGAFHSCEKLESVTIPNSVTYIDQNAFWGCSGLTSVVIPNSITKLNNGVFANCHSLTTIMIPSSVETIIGSAFQGSKKLSEINVAEDNGFYTSVGGVVFTKDKKTLVCFPYGYAETGYSIPENVTTLGWSSFAGCNRLYSVIIPSTVTKLERYTFQGCANLQSITCLSDIPPVCEETALSGIPWKKCALYVPSGSVEAYRAAEGWGDIVNIKALPNIYVYNGNNIKLEATSLDDAKSKATAENALILADGVDADFGSNFISNGKAKSITLTDAKSYYCPENIEVDTLRYIRTFTASTANVLQALYVPFAMRYSDWVDFYDVYRISAYYENDTDGDGEIDEQKLEVIKVKESHGYLLPNHPYMIKAKTTGTKVITLYNTTLYTSDINSIDCSTVETTTAFTGTYQDVTGMKTAGYYFMSGGALCSAASDATTLRGFRWFMNMMSRGTQFSSLSRPSQIKIRILGDNGTTELDDVEADIDTDINTEEAKIYSIDGRIVDERVLHKGLYIKNGKKIYIK